MSTILEVNDIYKKLGTREIIKGISFSVEEGEIFGFLGPNGAGKTTTIKMIVGLISPDKGDIKIANHNVQLDREEALSNVGAVVESPELYTYLTGRQNLEQVASFYNNITNEDIEKVTDLVGLTGRLDDKVKKYSLGMKQRLGLATALLSKPKLLILDEPTNGLDPSGIVDFRNLIKKTAKEMKTAVFVSSHILSEIEQLCDTVAFIKSGVIQSIEKVNKDTENGEASKKTDSLVLVTGNKDECIEQLNKLSFISNVNLVKEENKLFTLAVVTKTGTIPDIIIELSKANIRIEEIYKKHQQLEDRYMELVKGVKNNA